jgi:hypothetical protein
VLDELMAQATKKTARELKERRKFKKGKIDS